MPKFLASESYAPNAYRDQVQKHLKSHTLEHLRVRRRSDALIIESGPDSGSIKHARLRRYGQHLWRLDMAQRGRWQVTPFRGLLPDLLEMLTGDFLWTLIPRG
jgi:hypothetical protein